MKYNIRFRNKNRRIFKYYQKVVALTKKNKTVGSPNEWLIDNYYIVDSQKKAILYYLSIQQYKKVPQKDLLYDLVYESIDSRNFAVNFQHLFASINDYQVKNQYYFSYAQIDFIYNLIPIILINKLSDLVGDLDEKLSQKTEIEKLIEEINVKKNDANFDIEKIIKIDNSIIDKPFYIEELNYKLGELGSEAEKLQIKMASFFKEKGIELNKIITNQQEQAINENILIMNIFTSLKTFSKTPITIEGNNFYSNISFAEKTLEQETTGYYLKMTDDSKHLYRQQVIKKSKSSCQYEFALDLVKKAEKEDKHIGFYLFKEKKSTKRALIYIFFVVLFTTLLSYLIFELTDLFSAIIVLIPMMGLAIDIITQILLRVAATPPLLSLKVEDEIPEDNKTMVVIPTIIKDRKKVEEMFDNIETYYLSNKTDNLYFTLLGDAAAEKKAETAYDDQVIKSGLAKVKELNEKYGKKIFYFAYRRRYYSEDQTAYMGTERKRGALIEFNDLVLGEFSEKEKNLRYQAHTFKDFDEKIKYVITLDADTKLVLSTALKLVGVMMHPLNQPVLNEEETVVIKGHAMVQPKVNVDIEVTSRSEYSQLFGGLGGLDVYSTTTFDLYQDVFDEGSFVGKGIYDLEVFQKLLKTAFPDNLILSHDLLEGSYLRAGFASNIEFFDDFPSKYLNDMKRYHRWTRGDWQIMSWLKGRVKNQAGETVDNPISLISQWKIFDNLRRSLKYLFLTMFLLYGFIFSKASSTIYLVVSLVIITIPIFFYIFSLFRRRKYNVFLKYYLNLIRGAWAVILRSLVSFATLLHQTGLFTDAIIRAIYRLFVSNKNRLDWVTAEESDKRTKNNLSGYFSEFKTSTILALLFFGLSLLLKPENSLLQVSLLTLVWLTSPILMYLLSLDFKEKNNVVPDYIEKDYENIALKTWRFFEHYLVDKYNYLIPDNYQLNRRNKLDYRSSSTNIGFSLIAIVSAYELNFILLEEAIEKINKVITTIEGLEKWHGHLYNWYNIHDMKKITPHFVSTVDSGNFVSCLVVTAQFLRKNTTSLTLINRVDTLVEETRFEYLYDHEADVFPIGYDANENQQSNYNYEKFLSESRLTSYIAIALNQVPYRHWFSLDKSLTKYKFKKGLASWSGTSFEYFMPLIFMKSFPYTLIDESYDFAHFVQKEFIKEVDPKLPWGITESAYNDLDDSQNYKYQAFGIPYLKFADTKKPRIVISPYGSLLAASKYPKSVYQNILKLRKYDLEGEYGFYEAYDAEEKEVVKTYYSHHQGMILAAITNLLKKDVLQDYFSSDRRVKSTEILLKEKSQLKPYIDLKIKKYRKEDYVRDNKEVLVRFQEGIKPVPEYGLLSNGSYTTLINDRGLGYSKYKNLQINRYRTAAEDPYGLFLYIKDLNNNEVWTNTYEPFMKAPEKYNVTFEPGTVKYLREDDHVITKTELIVTKEHNAEIRKVTITNYRNEEVDLELTSYQELIIARNEEDIAHRAFNGVSISAEMEDKTNTLILKRHSRTKDTVEYFVAQRLLVLDSDPKVHYETSRANFIGRNRDLHNPQVITGSKHLSNDYNALIDPIVSLRKTINIKPNKQKTFYIITGFGKSKEQIMEIINTYDNSEKIKATFRESEMFGNMVDNLSNLNSNQVYLYNHLLKKLYHYVPYDLGKEPLLLKNELVKNDIWKFGVSDNFPIITVIADDFEGIGVVKQILKAYEYYKKRSIYVDIVILIKEDSDKRETIKSYVFDTINKINYQNNFSSPFGNTFVIEHFTEEDEQLFKLVSKIYFETSDLNKNPENTIFNKIEKELSEYEQQAYPKMKLIPEVYNQYGYFRKDGTEYHINTVDTPLPWSNVLSNGDFGTVITNNMGGFTYRGNSREYKITSWSNDSVKDPRSEEIIINDESLEINSATHGFGYSFFYTNTNNYEIKTTVFVGMDNVKVYKINLINKKEDDPSVDVKFSFSPVLGVMKEYNYPYIIANIKEDLNSVFLTNKYSSPVYKDREVFVTASEKIIKYDMHNDFKSITINLNVKHNENKEVFFIIGSSDDNHKLINKYKKVKTVDAELEKVKSFWEDKLSYIKVNTPDETFNYAINGWYLYQSYVSRIYAKTGLYQVGGAFGFRDQLQDSMSLIYSDPKLTKQLIINSAMHQFKKGDVLHWWHIDLKMGSRTMFSDDYLWLVFVTMEYIKITGDEAILNEMIPFVEGPDLLLEEEEKGINYEYSEHKASLYEHMKLSIARALSRIGKHGLPLIGVGDWNDGMNKVGHKGQGESVWVGMFLYNVLETFIPYVKANKDETLAKEYKTAMTKLHKAINTDGWDGSWYRRAFYDDGTPIGARNNEEGEIDLLVQSWSVLANVADSTRARKALQEADVRLVDQENKVIKLVTPPYISNASKNPGYISYYLKGLRENGGQYTHAALWYIKSLIKYGKIEEAYNYFAMINPMNRDLNVYKAEPYVIAADIYANKSHKGRGGWTWYTGSAGWAYKIAVEDILGLTKAGDTLTINPHIPKNWNDITVDYKYEETVYQIKIINPDNVSSGVIRTKHNNKKVNEIKLVNDHKTHKIEVTMGEKND